jgi:hypothetical protein
MSEPTIFSRRVPFTERVYLATLRRDGRGLTIQYLVEGEGQIERSAFETAIVQAAQAHPGARLVLRGHLGWSRWVACGSPPPIRDIVWDRGTPLPLECQRALDPRRGPTVEILLAPGLPSRIVFRCLHSVMDGAGLFVFIEDVFRILRGESPKGSNSTLTDSEFLQAIVGRRYRKNLAWNAPPLFIERSSGTDAVHEVRSRRVLQKVCPVFVAKTATALTRAFANGRSLRFMVPSNVRAYKRDVQSTANLSYPLFFDSNQTTKVETLQKSIFQSIVNKDVLNMDPLELKGTWLPLILIRMVLELTYLWQKISRKGLASVFISHTTFPSMGIFSCPKFKCTAVEYLPAYEFKFGTISITSIAFGTHQSIVVFAPKNWASQEQLQAVTDLVWRELEGENLA